MNIPCKREKWIVFIIINLIIGISFLPSVCGYSISNNHPPHDPMHLSTPDLPFCQGRLAKDFPITFSTYTTDPDNDQILYYIDWDDGTTTWTDYYESGKPVTVQHKWFIPGFYEIRVKAMDVHGAESNWSSWVYEVFEDYPPMSPSITGETNGKPFIEYQYTVSSTDPDPQDEHVSFLFNWDDETPVEWTSYIHDVGTWTESHYWTHAGEFSVTVKARDEHGAQSSWSDPLIVTIHRPEPDLQINGTLNWCEVKPGSILQGTFTVKNIGEPGSKLTWNITEIPDWGTWTFTPEHGENLTPENGTVTVQVSVKAPDEPNQRFLGHILIENMEDETDYGIVDVSLVTSKNNIKNMFDSMHRSNGLSVFRVLLFFIETMKV